MRRIVAIGMGVAALLGSATAAEAQEAGLVARCEAATPAGSDARRFCNLVSQAIEVVQAPLGLAVTGGNPVPGTASTLGMRLGTLPRFSVNARVTGVWTEIPDITDFNRSDEDIGIFLPSLNIDASFGLFSGLSLAPTVGGFGSVDLLASMGVIPLPTGDGFDNDSPFSWALGARVGILRESFTLPGISVSLMYRRLGDLDYGDPQLVDDDAFFDADLSIWSLRGAVSKRIAFLGATAGIGYDHYSSDLRYGFVNPASTGPSTFVLTDSDFENDRYSFFVNLSYTLLILHGVLELGWQQAGEEIRAPLPAGTRFDPDGSFFGSLAIRLSI